MGRSDGIIVPSLPLPRPRGYRRARFSAVMGFAAVLDPDGSVVWQEEDWQFNGLHDAGELSMLDVYLREQANVAKFLALLNDASLAETDGTMAAVVESKAPGVDGYARQQYTAPGDWVSDGLQGGDYRMSGAEKTFGPVTGTTLTATASAVTTTAATTAGLLLMTLPLSATTSVAVNQSLKYILRWAQS